MRTQLILDAGRGDSFVLLCLSLVALKRCFANHVQRLQLPHHLSRSPGDVCLPPSVWQSNLCPAGCLLKAEQPNSIALTLSAVSFLQSQWQSWKVSSWNFSPGFFMCHRSLAAEISHFWERQSPSCLTGENRNILPGLLLSSQWQVNQTEAALPKLLLHKSGLFRQYCKWQLPMQQLPDIPISQENIPETEIPEQSLFSFHTLCYFSWKSGISRKFWVFSQMISNSTAVQNLLSHTGLDVCNACYAQGRSPCNCLHSKPGKKVTLD